MSLTDVVSTRLVDEDDGMLDFVCRHAGVLPDDGDDRDVDFREHVRGHTRDGHGADRRDEHRHHDEGVSAPQC